MRAASTPALRAALDPAVPVFVLVDPLIGEPIALPPVAPDGGIEAVDAARRGAWQRDVRTVALPAKTDLAPWLGPYLVALEGPDDPLVDTTLAIARQEHDAATARGLAGDGAAAHRIGGWLQSALFADLLAERLSALLHAPGGSPRRATYLRQADRRVLDWLRVVVGDARAGAQLGRVQRWHYLDAFGELATLASPADTPAPLAFSRDEWRLMHDAEAIQRTLARACGERRLAGSGAEPPRYGEAAAGLRSAQTARRRWPARFESVHDISAWAALRVLHPALDDSPAVRELLDAAAPSGQPPATIHSLCAALHTTLAAARPARP